ncbi:hypothetical protein [Acanthopleuribacter pedis]|uniref:Uncharacterized protein n=1 Tax=Acanthopleuribacter pedis TaxID=442870 RepID=A0A8J7QLF8_9BACT|nr:hypothetical protein [Acanthopleuribacter pedis]MBO1323291.1 hypothetical protein [Acanthopleuribacter pedis]
MKMFVTAAAALFCILPLAAFDRALVPAEFQAAIFKQLCADYLPAYRQGTLVIVSRDGEDALAKEFSRAGFVVKVVTPEQAVFEDDQILYLPSRLDDRVAASLSKRAALVLTDNTKWVRRGLASLGIVVRQRRADVVAHVGRLEASGAEVGLGLFRYARVLDGR